MVETTETIHLETKIKIPQLALCILIGIAIWLFPAPDGLDPRGWHLLAIFIPTIVGIVIKPLPMGAVTFIAFTLSVVTGLITEKQAFAAFSNHVVWLVVMAFFISQGLSSTNLGIRIAYIFIRIFGKKTIGLSYGLAVTDLVMAPAIPSVTARAAGIVYPIVQSLANSFGSFPHSPSSNKIGAYLTITAFQITVITSSMFMTAMAANPLLAELCADNDIRISWELWALSALVPGIVSLIVIPYVTFILCPPEIKITPEAPRIAKENLKKLGKVSCAEWIAGVTLILLVILWVFGGALGISTLVSVTIGLAILIITGTIEWESLVKDFRAWDTFFWFCVLLLLVKYLSVYGLFDWFSMKTSRLLGGVDWKIGFPLLSLAYFYSHYFFASSTAHVSVMFVPFLLVALGLGTPPMLSALVLIFFSNLFGGITHYSLTPAPMMFGAGYVDIKTWWKIGFIVSVINILIWSFIGALWWSFLEII